MPGRFAAASHYNSPFGDARGAGDNYARAAGNELAHIMRDVETARDQYAAGLSYFPDRPVGFGVSVTDVAQFVPGGSTVAAGVNFASDIYSSIAGGSQRDQQRQARAAYFGQLALQGNVYAAQILLGALPNVSGNEQPFWQNWINQLGGTSTGQDTLKQAQQLGPYWLQNSTDTVTSYPLLRAYAARWSSTPAGMASQLNTNLAGGGGKTLLYVGLAGVALLLLSKKR
jgi:hypothetical protein